MIDFRESKGDKQISANKLLKTGSPLPHCVPILKKVLVDVFDVEAESKENSAKDAFSDCLYIWFHPS